MKRLNIRGLLIVVGLLLLAVVVLLTAKFVDRNYAANVSEPEQEEVKLTDSTIEIEHSVFSSEVYLINEPSLDYIQLKGEVTLNSIRDKYQYGEKRLDEDLPATIWYRIKGLPFGKTVQSSVLEVSEDPQYGNPRRFVMAGDECFTDVHLLKIDTTYYYRITLELSDGTVTGVNGQFKTADTPRMLSIDGVMNVRDLGGWRTKDGNVIRQGLLYRGGELDGAIKSNYVITEQGVNQMTKILGVRTEMDLRGTTLTQKPADMLGKDVKHEVYDAPMYIDALNSANNEVMREIFADLADDAKYPIYLHDTYGMDRTGTVCYLLGGLLGMSDDDLIREYRMSILCHGGLNNDEMTEFIFGVEQLPGATTQEKIEGYLLSIGVTANQIGDIREIFLTTPNE